MIVNDNALLSFIYTILNVYSVVKQQRRFLSTGTTTTTTSEAIKSAKNKYHNSFNKQWLSDPSTYPIIGVMVFATGMVTGVFGCFLYFNPEVQIAASKRGSIIRNWGGGGWGFQQS